AAVSRTDRWTSATQRWNAAHSAQVATWAAMAARSSSSISPSASDEISSRQVLQCMPKESFEPAQEFPRIRNTSVTADGHCGTSPPNIGNRTVLPDDHFPEAFAPIWSPGRRGSSFVTTDTAALFLALLALLALAGTAGGLVVLVGRRRSAALARLGDD